MMKNVTKDKWIEILKELKNGEITLNEACSKYKVTKSQYYYWKEKLGMKIDLSLTKPNRLVDITEIVSNDSIQLTSNVVTVNGLEIVITENTSLTSIAKVIAASKLC